MFITDEQWLNLVNGGLGVVVLIAVAVIGGIFARELYEKYHTVAVTSPAHEMFTDDLGMLFADGGEEIKSEELKDYHL